MASPWFLGRNVCRASRACTGEPLSPYGSYVAETLVTLLAVSMLAFVLLYGARRAGVGRPMGGLELVGRLPVDARRSILLVRVGPQVFMIGVSEAGLTKLGEMPSSDVPPPGEIAPTPSFRAIMGRKSAGEDGPDRTNTGGAA